MSAAPSFSAVLPYLEYLVLPIVVYAVLVYLCYRKGWIGPDRPLSLLGPCLMIKTLHGRDLLDRLGRRFRRFWNVFGDAGIVLGFAGMIAMLGLLAFAAYVATTIPATNRPSLSEAVTIPGLNPLLPLGYGLLALILGVVLHELCHGVLARANNIRVKSLGVLLLVIPLGAFVEQDEEDMTKAPARQRDRVAAAGVMANFVLAIVFFLLMGALLSTSVHAKADGVGVLGVVSGTPAANSSEMPGGVGLAPGDIITGVNGTSTSTLSGLETALKDTHPNETVVVQWYSQATSGLVAQNITLTAAIHYPSVFNWTNRSVESELHNTSFLGIEETSVPPENLLQILTLGAAAPGTGSLVRPGTPGFVASSAVFLILPETGEMPVQGTMAEFYTVGGPLGLLGGDNGWILINALYWLVWLNLLLGIFNALPAVPLDGGFLFRDIVGGFLKKLRPAMTPERRDALVSTLSLLATLAVFFLILWVVIIPQI